MPLNTEIKLFEKSKVRSVWDAEQEKWYISIVDVIEILTNSERPRKYWDDLKRKLKIEGSELSEKIGQLKMVQKTAKCDLLMLLTLSSFSASFSPCHRQKPSRLSSG